MTEPLNVRVAKALGCNTAAGTRSDDPLICGCTIGEDYHGGYRNSIILPYGENSTEGWACTGPLMEKYGIGAHLTYKTMDPPLRGDTWVAHSWNPRERLTGEGKSALGAVCDLIVAMAEAGRLK